MNLKLLTDETLRQDIDTELMFMVGCLASVRFTGPPSTDTIRSLVNEQLDLLLPTVKRHIKRHVRQTKLELSQRLSKTDSQVKGKKNALESPNQPERKV